jgi:transposase InsO family protein
MRLKLQGFSFNVVYRPGKFNPSDYTSRQPLPMAHSTKTDLAASRELEAHVHWVVEGDVPLPLTLNDIQRETMKDRARRKVYDHLQQGTVFRKGDKDLQPYQSIVGELSLAHGVIIRGRRIVLPTSLHKKVINTAHDGHQGLVKTKQLLRSRVWFPGSKKKVESYINTCIPCQATVHTASQEPVKSSILPNGPWECLSMDFYGPMPSGEYVLVVIDEYFCFPEVDIITSTSAQATLPKLDRILSSFGIPISIKTDNGPPFKSFNDYCRLMGIKHQFITPRHPRANGLVGNFNRMVKKVTRTAVIEHKSWKQELYTFLRSYRATPHSTTGESPANLLFQQRQYRVRLPELPPPAVDDKLVRDRDSSQKANAKKYADQKTVC